METFSCDSSILNYVQSLPMIVSKNEEEFDFSLSNVVAGVQKSNNLDFLQKHNIVGLIHSLSLVYIFQQIPT